MLTSKFFRVSVFHIMRVSFLKIVLFSFLLSAGLQANESVNETPWFPESIHLEMDFAGIKLKRSGTTTRTKYFFNIYKMAHYLDESCAVPSNKDELYEMILMQNCTKQISTVYLREIKVEKIKASLLSDIKLNTNDDEYIKMLPHIDAFMSVIDQDVKENDEFVLRWHPDGTIVSEFQGKVISTIKDENFARTLWSIWFGQFSVVKRDTLVQELITSS